MESAGDREIAAGRVRFIDWLLASWIMAGKLDDEAEEMICLSLGLSHFEDSPSRSKSEALTLGTLFRILREAHPTDEERATYAFRLCLGRVPSSAELKRLLGVVNTERQNFAKDEAAAKSFANVKAKSSDDPVQLAAWTVVGNVLLNLDEAVMKN